MYPLLLTRLAFIQMGAFIQGNTVTAPKQAYTLSCSTAPPCSIASHVRLCMLSPCTDNGGLTTQIEVLYRPHLVSDICLP